MKETLRRNSKQRQLILETVKASHSHPTAEEVYQLVRQKNATISLGTVYRNLNLLAEMGEIVNLSEGFARDHFDGVCQSHPHLVCSRCGQVFDLDCDIQPVLRQLSQQNQCLVQGARVTAFGLCQQCWQNAGDGDASNQEQPADQPKPTEIPQKSK